MELASVTPERRSEAGHACECEDEDEDGTPSSRGAREAINVACRWDRMGSASFASCSTMEVEVEVHVTSAKGRHDCSIMPSINAYHSHVTLSAGQGGSYLLLYVERKDAETRAALAAAAHCSFRPAHWLRRAGARLAEKAARSATLPAPRRRPCGGVDAAAVCAMPGPAGRCNRPPIASSPSSYPIVLQLVRHRTRPRSTSW